MVIKLPEGRTLAKQLLASLEAASAAGKPSSAMQAWQAGKARDELRLTTKPAQATAAPPVAMEKLMSDAPTPPARKRTKAAEPAKAPAAKPKVEAKKKPTPKPKATPAAKKAPAKPKAKAAPKPAKTEIVQTTAGPANKGDWNADFRRGWEDFEKGEDNRAEYRNDPEKLKAKDAYISGQTGAANYAKLQKQREANADTE